MSQLPPNLPPTSFMTKKEIFHEFYSAGALLEGHFLLSSGLHSEHYIQCARVMMSARRCERLCSALAVNIYSNLPNAKIDRIVAPAMGGILVGYELGRQMNVLSVFVERVKGEFRLRRGFDIPPGSNCLVVEDVITTGGSAREAIATVEEQGGRVEGVACLVDRSGGDVYLGVKLIPLITFNVPTYRPENLPPHLAARKPVRLGSRSL